jgi:DNA mismatch repair ATPase MutS
MYTLGFNGYLDCIEGLQENINNKKINYAEFSNDIKKNSMKKSYYACLKNKKPIKNTILLNKNKIINGPNASGKTTILKSTLITSIFSKIPVVFTQSEYVDD